VVIFVGGIHGNEPAAVIALESVIKTLQQIQPPFNGKFVALRGNITALSHSVRFMDEDMNRIWIPERIHQLRESPQNLDHTVEGREQRALFEVLQPYFRETHLPVYLIDLHTTSAKSAPFAILADTIRNRRFALNLHTPIILGLEELLDGTVMHYAGDLGFCSLAFESGQHRDKNSIPNHIAAIWIFLASAGCIKKTDISYFKKYTRRLKNACRHLPPVFEIKLRYEIQPGENFRMEPGYENFQPIKKLEILARNQDGEIRSPMKGNIFMPLYQAQGNDGFFIIRRIQYFWLKISEWIRRLHIEKILPLLPGIRRHPGMKNELIINPQIARWYISEIVHLLGYRKIRMENGRLIVTKRQYDLFGPERARLLKKRGGNSLF
jgi:hypothetical protein